MNRQCHRCQRCPAFPTDGNGPRRARAGAAGCSLQRRGPGALARAPRPRAGAPRPRGGGLGAAHWGRRARGAPQARGGRLRQRGWIVAGGPTVAAGRRGARRVPHAGLQSEGRGGLGAASPGRLRSRAKGWGPPQHRGPPKTGRRTRAGEKQDEQTRVLRKRCRRAFWAESRAAEEGRRGLSWGQPAGLEDAAAAAALCGCKGGAGAAAGAAAAARRRLCRAKRDCSTRVCTRVRVLHRVSRTRRRGGRISGAWSVGG